MILRNCLFAVAGGDRDSDHRLHVHAGYYDPITTTTIHRR